MGEKLMEILREAKTSSDAVSKVINRFIGFCELNAEDVLLDTNCGRGEFIISASKHIEHALGVVSGQDLYDLCVSNTASESNIDILNCKLDKLPFKRDMFTVVVNRFGLTKLENLNGTLSLLIESSGNKGRLCIQDFCDYDVEEIDEFFNRFDYEIFNKQTPVTRFKPSMIGCLGYRIIKEEFTEEETDLMWYIGMKNRSLIDMNKINSLIHDALNHPVLSKYVYLKNDILCIKRRIISIVAGK
jgi:hypothetical protein